MILEWQTEAVVGVVIGRIVVFNDSNYVTVGSNNDNRKGLEKAKISKYNSKKVKIWEKIYNYGYNSNLYLF